MLMESTANLTLQFCPVIEPLPFHISSLVDIPIEINGTGMSSGTLEFTGSALVFHKTTGEPFTVTYTVDA
jgi:hypothetical protein